MKYCEKCGAQLPDDAVFCDNCGNSFTGKTAADSGNKINSQDAAKKINKKKLACMAALIAAAAVAFTAVKIFKYMNTYPSKLEGVYAYEQPLEHRGSFCYIFSFKKDGTVDCTSQYKERSENIHALYSSLGETRHTGTYTAKKKKFTINLDNGMTVYDYQMTDNGLELTSQNGEKCICMDVTDGILGQQELKYEEAEALYEAGQYSEAMPIYESLNYYYDSGEKAEVCTEAILKETIKDIVIEVESLEQVYGNHFELRLKYTNGCIKDLKSMSFTIQIQDNESLVLAEANTIEDLNLAVGASKEKEHGLDIADTAAAQRIAQTAAKDLKLVFIISNVTFDGYPIKCENEVKEIKIQNKLTNDSASPDTDDQINTNGNTEDPAALNPAAVQGTQNPADASQAPTESAAAGGNTYNITYNIPNNADASQTQGYQEQSNGAWSYMLPDSNTRYISAYELQGMSGYELRIARNEIYARHGRKFTDPALSSYFNGKAWYVPTVDADKFNEDALSQIEKANLETIKKVEVAKGQ